MQLDFVFCIVRKQVHNQVHVHMCIDIHVYVMARLLPGHPFVNRSTRLQAGRPDYKLASRNKQVLASPSG